MGKILVAGGAGYIGSHMLDCLSMRGMDAVVADNLSTGHAAAVKHGELIVGDIRDANFLNGIFSKHKIDGVIDFAAFSLVGESCSDPLKYYANNVTGTIELLRAMHRHNVGSIVFSSTAAVYGEPEKQPIEETDRTLPTNPYGETKLAIERMLGWCAEAYGIKYASLRYFNAAGADPAFGIGEDHSPETHLIPIVLKAALGKRSHVGIYGTDYHTKDGTCIRDYIHVLDLANAHLLALEFLEKGGESGVFNLGNGSGFSVLEIIEAARRVTGMDIPARPEARRAGDPSVLVASNEKAASVLGWKIEHTSIEDIIASAWEWQSAHPEGYGK